MGGIEPSSANLMAAITLLKETLTSKIDTVTTEVSLIRHDMDKFRSRLSEAEFRISQVEDTVHTDSRELRILQKQVQSLPEKTMDMENRLCCNNLRVVGISEWADGAKPVEFVEIFLTTWLGLTDLPRTFAVERAHRVPTTPPIPRAPPRPFLIKLLNYRDRDRMLVAARNTPELTFDNTKVSLYSDYSPEVQQW